MTTASVLVTVSAAAYAGLVATTTPFTAEADLVVACGVAAGGVALVFRLAGRLPSFGRPAGAVTPGDPGRPGDDSPTRGGAAPWVLLLLAVVGWELFCYFGSPRSAHPTISSIYDALARVKAAKAAVALAWLALGWRLLR